jgi:dihydrofolate reductase
MATLVFSLQQSLDGYVDHRKLGPPGPALADHFLEQMRGQSGTVYGRRTYEIMRYWDEDQPDWDAGDHEFAAVWRGHPKWVVSRSEEPTGPNATLVKGEIGAAIRGLKAQLSGEIAVAGPSLAKALGDLGLIDEYRLYFRPLVLGGGTPFFAGPLPPLRLVASDPIGEEAVRLTYVPA